MINWGEDYDAIPKSMGLSLTVAKSMGRHQKFVLDFALDRNSTLLNNIKLLFTRYANIIASINYENIKL